MLPWYRERGTILILLGHGLISSREWWVSNIDDAAGRRAGVVEWRGPQRLARLARLDKSGSSPRETNICAC